VAYKLALEGFPGPKRHVQHFIGHVQQGLESPKAALKVLKSVRGACNLMRAHPALRAPRSRVQAQMALAWGSRHAWALAWIMQIYT
jgi:hypothetical protein